MPLCPVTQVTLTLEGGLLRVDTQRSGPRRAHLIFSRIRNIEPLPRIWVPDSENRDLHSCCGIGGIKLTSRTYVWECFRCFDQRTPQ